MKLLIYFKKNPFLVAKTLLGSDRGVDLASLAVDLKAKLPSYAQPAFIRIVRFGLILLFTKLKEIRCHIRGRNFIAVLRPRILMYLD